MKISQIKVMVCLEHFMLPYIPLLSFLFLSSSKNLKQFKVVCVNILKKLYLLDTEIIVDGNFLSSKIFKFSNFQFDVQLRAQTLKSRSLSRATSSALFKARLETAWPPFHSLFPFALWKGCFCTSCASLSLSPSESPSACLMPRSVQERIPEAGWGQSGCRARGAAAPGEARGTGSSCWYSQIKVATEKARGNGQVLWEREDEAKEEACFLQFTSAVEWRAKKLRLELLIPSVVKGK